MQGGSHQKVPSEGVHLHLCAGHPVHDVFLHLPSFVAADRKKNHNGTELKTPLKPLYIIVL